MWATSAGTIPVAGAAGNWGIGVTGSVAGEAQSNAENPTTVTSTCGSGRINLTWSAVVHATSYSIYQSTTSATSGFSQIATGVAATSYTTAPLTVIATYWYEVDAVITGTWTSGRSAASNSHSIVLGLICI